MAVSAITAASSKQQFLQLLVSQLTHQDPLEPVKQEDFLAQLAQFSTLEGVENLNANFSQMLQLQQLTNGASLLGRTAKFHSESSPTGVAQGIVQGISVQNGNVILNVGGTAVPLNDVVALAA